MKTKRSIVLFIFTLLFVTCIGCSSNSNEFVEEKVVTSPAYQDANGEIVFKGGSLITEWKDKWSNFKGKHQFRATIKRGHEVTTTTKCDYCKMSYFTHN
ncbi:MAG: hypothetical protein IJE76_08350 [Bacteroidales bacterium]|nr:hypothetical protein [Bacteroidales bacterium]